MADAPLQIKKYPNRRLYDTEQSRYITLDELAAIVRGGRRVRVVDAKTGADLTRAVLLQVVLEEQDRLDMLPVELLHHLIRAQGTVQQAPFTGWLKAVYEQWAHVGEAFSADWTPFVPGAAAMKNPLGAMMDAWRGAAQRSGPPPRPQPASPPAPEPPIEPEEPPAEPEAGTDADLAAEARALRQQMEDLLKRMGPG